MYKPDLGFMIYFDFVTGLPTRVQRQVQVVYGFYQAENPRTAPKALPLTDVEPQGTESQRAVMALSRQFARVPANPAFKVVLEIQGVQPATKDRGPRTHPIAWTALALFSSETELNRGMWRVPLFTPPVRADVPPDQLHSLHAIAGSDLFVRLVMAQQADVHNKSLPPPSPRRLTAQHPDPTRPHLDPTRPHRPPCSPPHGTAELRPPPRAAQVLRQPRHDGDAVPLPPEPAPARPARRAGRGAGPSPG